MRARIPSLEAVIVGEGYERDALERHIHEVGADDWISLPGRVDEAALIDLYRHAWVLASASAHEGWGMTVTEAAACATPAVATRIAGHSDAVVHERTGLLVDDASQLGAAIERVLTDDALPRVALGRRAHVRPPVHVGGHGTRHPRSARQRSSSAPPVVTDASGRSAAEVEPAAGRGRRREYRGLPAPRGGGVRAGVAQ